MVHGTALIELLKIAEMLIAVAIPVCNYQGSCGRRGGRSLRSFSMLPPPYGPKQVTAGKSYPSSPLSQPAVSLRSTYIAWTSLRMPLSERFNAL